MSDRYPGGFLTNATPTVSTSSATGVWTLEQQLGYQAQGEWPVPPPPSYIIDRSLRFNSADSAYISRVISTPTSGSNWTLSLWLKRSMVSNLYNYIFSFNGGSNPGIAYAGSADAYPDSLYFFDGSTQNYVTGYARYRDPSAWYHIAVSCSSNSASVYVNNTLMLSGVSLPSMSSGQTIEIGRWIGGSTYYFSGYMADVQFVDGQALTPSDFGQTDSTTGVWEPIAYSGSYGNNGFHLDFADNTSTTTLGYDVSGNNNNATLNNFSVTAGAGNDSLVDTPTPYGTDTGAGGEVRGNYCTLNALDYAGTLSNGNLDHSTTSAAWSLARSTIGITSGKWYWETTIQSGTNYMTGISLSTAGFSYLGQYSPTSSYGYSGADAGGGQGELYYGGSSVIYGASYSSGDIIGVAFDADAGTLTFYKNGVSQGQAASGIASGTWFPAVCVYAASGTTLWSCNFGQRPFAYTAPSGFKALCTTNLPEPDVVQGDTAFNTVLYTGNGSTQSITGVGFQPDFVWYKSRSNAYSNQLYDVIRGAGYTLVSDLTQAETYGSTRLQSFDSDGFTLGDAAGGNGSGSTFVAWNWKANGAGSSNTDGTITSTVSANPTAGISVVTWTASGADYPSIGHGLGAAPACIITKSRTDGAGDWSVYHKSLGNNDWLRLNTSGAITTTSNYWATTSSTFSVGVYYSNNNYGSMVTYCFLEIDGFSSFGSYTGNGSTDGPFVYTGFRPAYVLVKSSTNGASWDARNIAVNTYNPVNSVLQPNTTSAEYTYSGFDFDFLSNGFKVRGTDADNNTNGQTYIYIAFAENPFKYSLAR